MGKNMLGFLLLCADLVCLGIIISKGWLVAVGTICCMLVAVLLPIVLHDE